MAIMSRFGTATLAAIVAAAFGGSGSVVHAELLIADQAPAVEYYGHPVLRSLVFVSPETRAQSILPPAPVFVAPPSLIWRAPGAMPVYPPATVPGFNRPGSPSNRDVAAYNLARAHAFSQDLYRQDGNTSLWYGPARQGDWLWLGAPTLYPPLAPGLNHPSNRDNAGYLIERAHRFSQDAYRKP